MSTYRFSFTSIFWMLMLVWTVGYMGDGNV